jgi:peptide/nickel transport system permease protein
VRFVVRRLGFFVLTLWVALTLNFVIPRLMPGDPALAIMARFHGRIQGSALRALEVEFGVNSNESMLHQYFDYLRNTLTGNLGISTTQFPLPVTDVIRTALPWTLGLIGVTTVLAFVFGTGIGVWGGWRRGSWTDNVLPPVFIVTSALPYFWVGMMLILLFSALTNWLPANGAYDTSLTAAFNWQFIGSVLQHALLPALTLLITTIGTWILTMRNNMITTVAEDYVRMGRAKGLSNQRIMYDYAARNAMLPSLTGFAMSLGFVVSGATLVEYVFNYPGLGFYLLQAAQNEDFALMQGLFLLITVAVLVAILAADVLTAILDPRTRSA